MKFVTFTTSTSHGMRGHIDFEDIKRAVHVDVTLICGYSGAVNGNKASHFAMGAIYLTSGQTIAIIETQEQVEAILSNALN